MFEIMILNRVINQCAVFEVFRIVLWRHHRQQTFYLTWWNLISIINIRVFTRHEAALTSKPGSLLEVI